MKRHMRALLGLAALLLVGTGAALAQSGSGFDLSWNRIAGGGATFSSGSGFTVGGTIGQAEAGTMSGSGFSVLGGFWSVADTTSTPTPTATSTPTNSPTATSTPSATITATLAATSTSTTVAPSSTPTAPLATATRTSTPASPSATPTITPTPFPRPNVGVLVVPDSVNHVLNVTITPRDAGCANNTQNNQLQSIQFTRVANASVDVGSPPIATVATPTTVPLPTHPTSIPLIVHRPNAGQATTVELIVTDGCGSWPTLVGGGPTAF